MLVNRSIEKNVRADLSKETAGELLLYNLRKIKEYPYLTDILAPSSFSNQNSLIENMFFSNAFSEKGIVNIAGSNVELQILHHGWIRNADTQLRQIKPFSNTQEIKVVGYNTTIIIVYRFFNNIELFNNVCNYLKTGSGLSFAYLNQ